MKKENVCFLLLTAAGLFSTFSLSAQRQDSLSTVSLDEIVVTATKFPKAQGETGKVLTIIDEAQIRRSAGKDLSQLLNEQVGLVVSGANSNPGKDKAVYLRGAGTGYTLILVDGIPLNDPSGFGGAFDLRMLPLDQVERIEILKGSQSTLYGSDAVAGVINIITRKKEQDKPFGVFGNVSGGSYGTRKGTLGVTGGSDVVDYNASYTHYKSDGISEAYDRTGNGGFDKDGLTQDAWQVSAGIKPVDKIELRPFLRYTKFDGDFDAEAFSDDPTSTYNSKLFSTGLTGQWDYSKGSVNVLYAYDRTTRTYHYPFADDKYDGRFNHGEVFANYTLAKHVQALAGVSFQHQNMKVADNTIERSSDLTSPYVSLLINDVHGFYLEAGARYVSHSQYDDVFTYSINPSYRIHDQARIFANYSTGFKAPTLNQLYGQFGANPDLKPEESKSLEGGVQLFSKDKAIDVRATIFRRSIDQLINYGFAGYENVNKQKDHGVEIEPGVRVNEALSIRGFYGFATGEITTRVGDHDSTYNNLIRRPKHSFGVMVSYQVTSRLHATLNYKTFGKRKDLFFDPVTYEQSQVSLDAYQLLDLNVSYSFLDNRLNVFADARNILNQEYEEVYGYSTMKFNVNAGVSFRF